MIIVLMGLDGSGKTTQAKRLLSYFQKREERVSYIHWLHFYPSKKARPRSAKTNYNNLSKNSIFYITTRTLFCILNAFLVFLKIIFDLLMQKNVILDRYLIDEVVQLRYKGLSRKLFLFFLKIVPITKNMFYFQISPQKAFEREGSHDFNYFEKKHELYNQAVDIKRVKIIRVDGEEETFQRLLKELL